MHFNKNKAPSLNSPFYWHKTTNNCHEVIQHCKSRRLAKSVFIVTFYSCNTFCIIKKNNQLAIAMNLTISESNNWTDASKHLTTWLISMSLEQIWLTSIDFSQRRHILALWLLFVIHNIKNWWKHKLILTYEMAVILQYFYVDLYLCLPQWEIERSAIKANALAGLKTLFFSIFRATCCQMQTTHCFDLLSDCHINLSLPVIFIAIFEFFYRYKRAPEELKFYISCQLTVRLSLWASSPPPSHSFVAPGLNTMLT